MHMGWENAELTQPLAAVFESGSRLIHNTLERNELVLSGVHHRTSLPLGIQRNLSGPPVLSPCLFYVLCLHGFSAVDLVPSMVVLRSARAFGRWNLVRGTGSLGQIHRTD